MPQLKLLASEKDIPVELFKETVIQRTTMKSTHVEVGKIIVRQMEVAANENQMGISVLSDDTDIFVLLLYEFLAQKLKLPLITEPPKTVPKLASLSPTSEALTEKIERAHYHACVWKHASSNGRHYGLKMFKPEKNLEFFRLKF